MESIDISLIVPIYDTKAEYLRECIESILGQDYKNIELVLISDGARDELIKLCESYLIDERVSLYLQENSGVSVARNLGIKQAKGKYITFVDSDDYIDKSTCTEVIRRFEEDNLDVLLWGSYKFDSKGVEKYMPFTNDIRLFTDSSKALLELKTMSGTLPIFEENATVYGSGSACSKLYRRDFLMENDLHFPEGIKRAEDVNFHIRVFDKANRIGYMAKNLYYYRQNEASATYKYRPGGITVFTDALNCLWDFIKDKDETFKEVYYMRCMFFLLESMDMDYLNRNNNKSFLTKRKELLQVMRTEPYFGAINNMSGKYLSLLKRVPYYLIKLKCAGLLMLFYKIYRLL